MTAIKEEIIRVIKEYDFFKNEKGGKITSIDRICQLLPDIERPELIKELYSLPGVTEIEGKENHVIIPEKYFT